MTDYSYSLDRKRRPDRADAHHARRDVRRRHAQYPCASLIAGINVSGLPERPNPPDIMLMPSNKIPSSASAGLEYILLLNFYSNGKPT
jgi:hypothetical protein